MPPQRARMMDDMILAGLAEGTRKLYVQAVRRLAAHYHRSPICSARKRCGTTCSACASEGWPGHLPDQSLRPAFLLPTYARPCLGAVRGRKGSPRYGRSGCLTRYRMIRSVACSAVSAAQPTRPASPSCLPVVCASAKPLLWKLAPSTGPTRCCVSSARACPCEGGGRQGAARAAATAGSP
jgi:hypothetical protein